MYNGQYSSSWFILQIPVSILSSQTNIYTVNQLLQFTVPSIREPCFRVLAKRRLQPKDTLRFILAVQIWSENSPIVCKFQISFLPLDAVATTSVHSRLSSAQCDRDLYLAYSRVLKSTGHQLVALRRFFVFFLRTNSRVHVYASCSSGFFPFGNRNVFDKDVLLVHSACSPPPDEGECNQLVVQLAVEDGFLSMSQSTLLQRDYIGEDRKILRNKTVSYWRIFKSYKI